MRVASRIISALAYMDVGLLAWALVSLNSCGGNDGCLGYIAYFWIGIIAAIGLIAAGTVVLIGLKRLHLPSASLIAAILTLILVCASFGVVSYLSANQRSIPYPEWRVHTHSDPVPQKHRCVSHVQA